MSFIKRLAGDTAWYGLSSIVSRVIMFFILAPYLTSIFQNDEYGIHGIMYAFAALLLTFYTFRLETAFFRYGSKDEDLEATFWTASICIFALGIFFTTSIVTWSEQIAAILTKPQDSRFVVYFACIICLDAIAAIPFARLRLEHRPRRFAVIKIINIVVTVAVMLFLLEGLKGLSSNGNALAQSYYSAEWKLDYVFIANICGSGITFLFLLPSYLQSRIQWNNPLFYRLVRYSAPLLIVGVAGTINQLTDRFFVKEWLPGDLSEEEKMGQAGIYTAAARIAVIINLFTQAYNYAAEPFFFNNAEEGGSRKVYARSAEAFMIVGTCGFLLLSLNMHTIKYLIDSSYWSGLYLSPLLMVSYLMLGLYYNISIWYKLSDLTKYGALFALIGAIITIGLNYLLIPLIGMLGAALTSLTVYSTMNILAIIVGRKYYPIPYRFQRILFYPLIAIGLFYAYYFSVESPFEFTFNKIALSNLLGLIFIAIIAFLERGFLQRILSGRFKNLK